MELSLHPSQINVFNTVLQSNSRTVLACGRRWGKTEVQIACIIARTLLSYPINPRFKPTCLFAAPTLVQARAIIWDRLKTQCELTGLSPKVNNSTMTIDFGHRFPLVRLAGTNDKKGLGTRGAKYLHVALDECQGMILDSLQESIFPGLADTPGSTLLVTGTPLGRSNTLYKLFSNPEYKSFNFPSWDNVTIPNFKKKIFALKKQIPPRAWSQEFLASFEDAEGLFFSSYNSKKHRFTTLPRQRYIVYGGYDPGAINPGICVVLEGEDKIFYVVEAENLGDGINAVLDTDVSADLLKRLSQYGNTKAILIDPSRPDIIKSLHRYGGIKGYNPFTYGINTVNALFHQNRILIRDTLEPFSDLLTSYTRYKNSDGSYSEDRESNGIPTHAIDAFRYILATINHQRHDEFTRFVLTT